jgi:hypothetical protein
MNLTGAACILADMPRHVASASSAQMESPESLPIARFDSEEIAKLAYRLWVERGMPEGSPEKDWYRAQQILGAGKTVTA